MITKFQFEAVKELYLKGVTNYIQIRQQVGLTSDELDDVIDNFDYYQRYFQEQDRLKKFNEVPKKKHWWQKQLQSLYYKIKFLEGSYYENDRHR